MSTRHTTSTAHRSEHGSWLLVRAEPAPQLRAHVYRYEGYRENERRFDQHLQTPTTRIPLIINLGSPYRVDGPVNRNQIVGSFAAGLHDGPVLVGSDGPQHCLQVDLTPLGARRIFGLPMHELSNRVVELDDLFGRQAPLLAEQLHGTPGWDARFDIIDAVLTTRINDAPAIPPGVTGAWERLARSGGTTGIGELAGEFGWSHKHLIAQFRAHIGLPPKKLARILRFERALAALNGSESVCLASVAQATGYFDQAHLHRDVRQFAGLTPADLLRRRLPDLEGLIGD